MSPSGEAERGRTLEYSLSSCSPSPHLIAKPAAQRSASLAAVPLPDINKLSPVGPGVTSPVTNKAGRMRAHGTTGLGPIKIYEAASTQHAHFIKVVSAQNPDLFPPVVGTNHVWVAAAWARGRALRDRESGTWARTLLNLQQIMVPSNLRVGFSYLDDYVFPRYRKAASIFGHTPIDTHLKDRATAPAADKSRLLSHPDFSRKNLLSTERGIIALDNELLGVTSLPLLDVCNAVRSASPKTRKEFLAAWWGDAPAMGESEIQDTAVAWFCREVGATFQSGQFSRCMKLLESGKDKGRLVERFVERFVLARVGA